jgi:CRISPR/Cas system-associated exonuclease Cas4 (RecB family)
MENDLSKLLTTALTGWDRSRDRSQQVEIGPSSIGGCRRKVWYQLNNQPQSNHNTENLAAILGTFIHGGISEAIKREDPFGDNFLIEQEFSHEGMKGHVDLFIKDQGLVVDWKTTTKKNLRYFPSKQQVTQVQIYGWLLENNGYEVNNVSLVVIPRDGQMNEIRSYVEAYNPQIAEEGLDWLYEVQDAVTPPAPEKYAAYCAFYCEFFDPTGESGCQGIQK